MDVTSPVNTTGQFTGVDTLNLPVTVTNTLVNFGWEYVWHCHLLGHEENDMMRPMIIAVAPEAPTGLTAVLVSNKPSLSWKDNSLNETSFVVQRAINPAGPWTTVKTLGAYPGIGTIVKTTDNTAAAKTKYYYRVFASNLVGSKVAGYPTATANSQFAPLPTDPPFTVTTK
jgi:hypothetical protein